MIKRIAELLKPDKNKWFDLNDLKVIGLSVLTIFSVWFLVSFTIIVMG